MKNNKEKLKSWLALFGLTALAVIYASRKTQPVVATKPLTRFEKLKTKLIELKSKAKTLATKIWANITAPFVAADRIYKAVTQYGTPVRTAIAVELPSKSTVFKAAIAVTLLAIFGLKIMLQAAVLSFAKDVIIDADKQISPVIDETPIQPIIEEARDAAVRVCEEGRKTALYVYEKGNEAVLYSFEGAKQQTTRLQRTARQRAEEIQQAASSAATKLQELPGKISDAALTQFTNLLTPGF